MPWQKASTKCSTILSDYEGDANDVIRRFSSQHIAEEYEQLFQELIKGGHLAVKNCTETIPEA